jgi:hypothetical protein
MSIKGWVAPENVPSRKAFSDAPSVITHNRATTPGTTAAYVDGRRYREELGNRPSATPPNERVHSKNERRYGRNTTTGQQPAGGPDREPNDAPPSMPATHVGKVMAPHVETAGWHPHSGRYVHPTHPVAETRGHTNAVLPHTSSRPTGMADSASGGKHGEPQTRPESKPRERGARTIHNVGTLNDHRRIDRFIEEEHRLNRAKGKR